jgi:hypothetical protein
MQEWKLAVIFQVVLEGGCIILDRSVKPRVADHLSVIKWEGETEEHLRDFQNEFIPSILDGFIGLMFQFGHHQLYPELPSGGRKPPWPPTPFDDPIPHGGCPLPGPKPWPHGWPIPGPKPSPHGWPPRPLPYPHDPTVYPGHPDQEPIELDWELMWKLFIKESSLHGYHHIMSVTQAGLNAHWIAIWNKAKAAVEGSTHGGTSLDDKLAVLVSFSSKKQVASGSAAYLPHFTAQCGAPQVELICPHRERSPHRESLNLYFNLQTIRFEVDAK